MKFWVKTASTFPLHIAIYISSDNFLKVGVRFLLVADNI